MISQGNCEARNTGVSRSVFATGPARRWRAIPRGAVRIALSISKRLRRFDTIAAAII
jgi:hypothetical protein